MSVWLKVSCTKIEVKSVDRLGHYAGTDIEGDNLYTRLYFHFVKNA
jgi:hypothetical protein